MIVFFFYNHAPTKLYTLSLHDALPISRHKARAVDQLYRNEPLAIYTPRVLRLVLNPQFSTDARSPEIGDSTIRLDRRERIIRDRKSTRLNSSHPSISYAVFCLKKTNCN